MDDYKALVDEARAWSGKTVVVGIAHELARAVEAQTRAIAALEAVIEKVRARGEFLVRVSDPSKYAPASPARVMSVDGQRFGEEMIEMASAPPSTVLDQMIREAKAEAWDEGASDGQWNVEHEAMIERGNRDAIQNPYRNGDA
jgi:Asp-tRNA(Asn)/Glu-tRNA(Gln) amidotransferase A subunit family amidase